MISLTVGYSNRHVATIAQAGGDREGTPEGSTCSRYQAITRKAAHSMAIMPIATFIPL